MKLLWQRLLKAEESLIKEFQMNQVTIRSDRDTDYTFSYKGEDVVLKARSVISIANGLQDVVLPTCKMKIANNLIVVKE